MLQVSVVKPSALAPEDRAAWLSLCAAEPQFHNPLLGPDFTEGVGRVRGDARVAIWRRDGAAVAFLPHHLRSGGLARPIGAPFSDVHGLVSARDANLAGPTLLKMAGVEAWRVSGLVDPHGLFAGGLTAVERERFVIDLAAETSGERYLEGLRAGSAKRFKNLRRLEHRLEREVGELTFDVDRDPAALETLITWKSEQLRRSGLHDVYRPAWVGGLMRNLFAQQDGPFQGVLLTLRAGGRVAAGHFGVRLGSHYHPWIASFDPALAECSPGQVFLTQAIRNLDRLGLSNYDLSGGHDHYKAPFANHRAPVLEGFAIASGVRGAPAGMVGQLARLLGPAQAATAARVERRLDQIAAVELGMGGRLRGVVEAASAWRLRARAQDAAA
jgi:CelD/BcsL family acetyltransferase involved in cellulose biosynthesis